MNKDFNLKGKHLKDTPCEEWNDVLHPKTCTSQVLINHNDPDTVNLFNWITTPDNSNDEDYSVNVSLIKWLKTNYPHPTPPSMQVMSASTIGGAKLGNYLTVDGSTKKLSVDLTTLEEALWEDLPIATYTSAEPSQLGGITADSDNFILTAGGSLSLKTASYNTLGGIKLGLSQTISTIQTIADGVATVAYPVSLDENDRAGVVFPTSIFEGLSTWYLDSFNPEKITSSTDKDGYANHINTEADVNYVLLGNTTTYGTLSQPTLALVAGSGIEFEYDSEHEHGLKSLTDPPSYNQTVKELQIKSVLPKASTSRLGGVKLSSDSQILEPLSSWEDIPADNYKIYRIQSTSDGTLGIKLGLGTTNLPAATENVLGGIKTGYTTNANNFAVTLDNSNNAYAIVPIIGKNSFGVGRLFNDPHLDAVTVETVTTGDWYAVERVKKTVNGIAEDGYLAVKLPKTGNSNNNLSFDIIGDSKADTVKYNDSAAVESDSEEDMARVLTQFTNDLGACSSNNQHVAVSIVQIMDDGPENMTLDTIQRILDILVTEGRETKITVSVYIEGALAEDNNTLTIAYNNEEVLTQTKVYYDDQHLIFSSVEKNDSTSDVIITLNSGLVEEGVSFKLDFIPNKSNTQYNSLHIHTYGLPTTAS